jgi:hypothetical protein
MSKSGIFDPYAPPKPKAPPARKVDLNASETPEVGPSVRLDGDSYVVVLNNTKLEDVPTRLAKLVGGVPVETQTLHQVQLTADNPYKGANVVTLPTALGFLHVFVGEGGTEVDAFRRIGHMLYGMHALLKQHDAKIVIRG